MGDESRKFYTLCSSVMFCCVYLLVGGWDAVSHP